MVAEHLHKNYWREYATKGTSAPAAKNKLNWQENTSYLVQKDYIFP